MHQRSRSNSKPTSRNERLYDVDLYMCQVEPPIAPDMLRLRLPLEQSKNKVETRRLRDLKRCLFSDLACGSLWKQQVGLSAHMRLRKMR